MLNTYIKETWGKLRRNALDVALDPKVSTGRRSFLYIPKEEDPARINLMIAERRKLTEDLGAIEVRVLPDAIEVAEDHGILYLPHDYVVPGGRFNEMYGWDSYWIVLGLLQDGYAQIAKGMVENCFYQIEHYGGKVLNANRTYYLSRAQPPMLGVVMAAVLKGLEGEERHAFLLRGAEAIAREYNGFWKTERFNPQLGLFHYGNIAQGALGPCPEVSFGERDEQGFSHYDKIAAYLRDLPLTDAIRKRFYDEATQSLTPEAWAGDRGMRESGFDASMQMGYYGLETLDFNPVCLNTLLTVQCRLLAGMYQELGQVDRARHYEQEAAEIEARMRQHMWDAHCHRFAHFNHRDSRPSPFPYLTCAYPLWSGMATPDEAQHFRDSLDLYETPYGMQATTRVTGCQWDAPFMWAPLVYFAVGGLHRYGFTADAQRIAQKFLDTVQRVFERDGANFEKYNAVSGGIRTEGIVDVGYSENVIGFGWTNGVVLALDRYLHASDPKAAGDCLLLPGLTACAATV